MKNDLLQNKRERDSSDKIDEELESNNLSEGNEIKIIEENESGSEPKEQDIEYLPKKKLIISKDQEEEDPLSEMVFQLNSKNTGIECFICKKDLTKNIKFLCEKCNNQVFCIKCFIEGKHPKDHKFHVIDNLNYPLFTEDWKMHEEYKLLVNLSTSGLNNWEDISNIMGNRGQVECESHYYSFYYTQKEDPLPKENSIIIDNNKNIIKEKLEINKNIVKNKLNECQVNKGNSIQEQPKEVKVNKRNSRCLCLRKNPRNGEAESAAEILGCRPKRHEFETEFLNDTEIEISHLEFDENDKEDDLKIKYDVLKDYNLRIKEREERKNFVFEKGLLDLRRQNRIESKLSRDEFELLLFLKPFLRFYENSEFFDLFEGIVLEQELKLALKNLNKLENEKTSKGEKISSIDEIENYFEIDKNLNRTRKSGNLFTNISEPKNIMNLLGHRVERFLEFQKVLSESNKQDSSPIFDDDEYQLVKEMPLARSTFYDIKKRANNILNQFNNKNTFSHKFMDLLEKFDLEIQTKNDIYEFYMKKFNDSFTDSNKKSDNDNINFINNMNSKNNINSINSINSSSINIINNKGDLMNSNNPFNEEQNNHNTKFFDYQTIKTNFKNSLENEK